MSAYNRYRLKGKVVNITVGPWGAGVTRAQQDGEEYQKSVHLSVAGYTMEEAFAYMAWMLANKKRFTRYIEKYRSYPTDATANDMKCKFPNVKRLKPLWKVIQARKAKEVNKPRLELF